MTTLSAKIAIITGTSSGKGCRQPEEVAQAAKHLASDAASFVTGASMLVDGGVSFAKHNVVWP